MEFLYKNLSPEDFEELAQDLLSEEYNVHFERFKRGKDGGIDLRLLQDSSNTIVQVKHMLGSYGSAHRSTFKREIQKAKSNPEIASCSRYILFTSSNLSNINKKDLRNLSDGLIKSDNDIYGLDQIEDRLNNNEKLVRRHVKLWISSTHVLSRVLNNRVVGKSDDYYIRMLEKKIPLFVKTSSFDKATEILNVHRILVLTGEPGIGKTTLSEFICFCYVGSEYEFVYCDSVDEAEDVFEPNKKQIFLIDDFLGSSFLETFTQKEESRILRFMDRVEAHKDKILILNSRTTIFSQASALGIHWGEKNWDSLKYHLDIKDLSPVEKARMLYNHLVFGGLERDYFDTVRKGNAYLSIVKHNNFNPRIMEFITSKSKLQNIPVTEYLQIIQNCLDNPSDIWLSAYKNQINDEQRWLIQTLFSFKGQVEEPLLKLAFEIRLKYEVDNNGHKRTEDSFPDAIKGLQDGFIYRIVMYPNTTSQMVHWRLLNPSIYDFILNQINSNDNSLRAITDCVCSFLQWHALFPVKQLFEKIIGWGIPDKILTEYKNYKVNIYDNNNIDFSLISLFRTYKLEIEDEFLLKILSERSVVNISGSDLATLIKEFQYLESKGLVGRYLKTIVNPVEFMRFLLIAPKDIDDLESVIHFLSNNMNSWDDLKDEIFADEEVKTTINELVDSESTSLVDNDDDLYLLTNENEITKKIHDIEVDFEFRLTDMGLDLSNYSTPAFLIDCEELASKNFERETEDSYHDSSASQIPSKDEITDIDIVNVFKE